MGTLILPLAAFLLAILILILYFSKKRINNDETKIYSKMLVVNFMYSLLAILIFLYAKIIGNEIIIMWIQKFYMILMLLMIMYITKYNVVIVSKKIKIKKIINVVIEIIMFISSFLIIISPLNVINEKDIIDGNGLSYEILIYAILVYLLFIIVSSIIIFIKSKSFKKNLPFIILIILFTLGFILREHYPSVIFETFLFTYMLFIMYFTIENPDLKVVDELLRNKELVESQMEDKSDFLFEMSQGVKLPAKNILELTKTYIKLNNDIDKNDVVRLIGDNANELIFKTNNILNVSSMDASKIKIVKEEYNIRLLFDEIKALAKNKIGDKKINININIHNNVPERLSGDDIKIKQIIMSLIINSIKHTKSGSIDIDVSSIVRYDVARLIIKVSDTGCGMSLTKINEVLSKTEDLNEEEVKKLDDLDIDLRACIKIARLLGGNINVKSELEKGSTFTLVLDQICLSNDILIFKKIDKYSTNSKKRILLVDDDKEETFKIKNILLKYNFDINTTMIGKDCISRINFGESYDLIIINDELSGDSAFNVLKELNKINKFKTNVIVVLGKDKEHFKNHFKEDGFKDFILKNNLTEDVERIIKKYLL